MTTLELEQLLWHLMMMRERVVTAYGYASKRAQLELDPVLEQLEWMIRAVDSDLYGPKGPPATAS